MGRWMGLSGRSTHCLNLDLEHAVTQRWSVTGSVEVPKLKRRSLQVLFIRLRVALCDVKNCICSLSIRSACLICLIKAATTRIIVPAATEGVIVPTVRGAQDTLKVTTKRTTTHWN